MFSTQITVLAERVMDVTTKYCQKQKYLLPHFPSPSYPHLKKMYIDCNAGESARLTTMEIKIFNFQNRCVLISCNATSPRTSIVCLNPEPEQSNGKCSSVSMLIWSLVAASKFSNKYAVCDVGYLFSRNGIEVNSFHFRHLSQ